MAISEDRLLVGLGPADINSALALSAEAGWNQTAEDWRHFMAQRQGIAAVHQEFSLVPQLSIARNVFLGREPQRGFHTVDRDRLMEQTRALLTRFGLDLDPEAEVASLSVADQQIVEIARALSLDARILILDEPTAVLALAEQDALFGIVRRLRNDGILVLYVSHHLNEVLAIADRLTILRDGRKIATRKADGMMISRFRAVIGACPSPEHRIRAVYRLRVAPPCAA